MVATHIAVELGDGEVAVAMAGGVDEAFVDEAGAGRAELVAGPSEDGGAPTGIMNLVICEHDAHGRYAQTVKLAIPLPGSLVAGPSGPGGPA